MGRFSSRKESSMKKITIYTSTRAKGNIKVIFLDVIRFYTYGVEISVIYSLRSNVE